MNNQKAVVLLSGGLDSATVLAMAKAEGYECHALSVAYGQRHSAELLAAERVARRLGAESHKQIHTTGIPVTYVPARNTLFLALALGQAEVVGAGHLFIGVNAVDYSGYPDCRPAFIEAFQQLAAVATKAGVEGAGFKVHTPLIALSKADIIRQGTALGVNFAETVSCYQADADGRACRRCDSCRIRAEGFSSAGLADPTRYQ